MHYPFDIDIHADPLRASAPMAIDAAVNVRPLNTDVVTVRAAIAPPFSRTKQTDHWRACCYGQMCRTSIAADIHLGVPGERDEPL
jgi:hypothetical protein